MTIARSKDTPALKSRLLFVVGPTATGKSELAVEIAERWTEQLGEHAVQPAALINCDSVAFFDRVQIGAAKPTRELLGRAEHHFIGHIKPMNTYTAGDFRRDALRLIEQNPPRRYLVVGGSGFYSQALEKGMYDVTHPSSELKAELAREAETNGMTVLYAELLRLEPLTRIQPADHFRILRALEILRSMPGKTLAEIKAVFEAEKPVNPFTSGKIALFSPRDVLRKRVAQRTKQMLADGLIDEVVQLRQEGLSQWSPMHSVGYHEVQAFLDGKLKKEDLASMIVTSTMQVAKQQMTWFKRDPSTRWFDADEQWKEAVEAGGQLLNLS